MAKKTKRVLVVLIAIVLAALAYGYYLYNKGPVNVINRTAVDMKAGDLYQQFIIDSAGAIKKYAGKVIAVTGTVEGSSLNQQKQLFILMRTGTSGAYINCTLEKHNVQIDSGRQLTIKGICSGIGQGDEELGIRGDVYLTRCYVIK